MIPLHQDGGASTREFEIFLSVDFVFDVAGRKCPGEIYGPVTLSRR